LTGLASDENDILDALASLWNAERIYSESAVTIPFTTPKDSQRFLHVDHCLTNLLPLPTESSNNSPC
jgi:hypothetical protein